MKYCTKCGNELKDTDIFCAKCGIKVEKKEDSEDFFSQRITYANENKEYVRKKNGLASAGFTFSFLGFALSLFLVWAYALKVTTNSNTDVDLLKYIKLSSIFFSVFGLGLSIPGVVFGVKMQYKKARAIAGIVLAGIALFIIFSLTSVIN